MNEKLSSIHRVEVFGVPVDCVDMVDAVAVADEWIKTGNRARAILAVNPEKIINAQNNKELLDALRLGGLLIPDGIGVVLATRMLGLANMKCRVPGAELMPALCDLCRARGYGVYLFGATPETNEQAANILAACYPGLRLAGRHHGYVKAGETAALVQEINQSGADVLFVAIGSPKQELWIANNLSSLTVKVIQGVGGTFDVIAGNVRRAPGWALRMNIEWLYRLLSQPSRLKRQTALPRFAWQVVRALFTAKASPQT